MLADVWPSSHWWNHDFLPWLEPVATALGLIAASLAAIYAIRVYRREDKRERRIEDALKRAQASLVSGWLGEGEVVYRGYPSTRERTRVAVPRQGLYLRNASELPVFNVRAEIRGSNAEELQPLEIEVLPPTSTPEWFGIDHLSHGDWDGSGRISLTFTDSSGHTWRRLADGRLLDPDEDGVGWAGISLA